MHMELSTLRTAVVDLVWSTIDYGLTLYAKVLPQADTSWSVCRQGAGMLAN